VQGVRWNNRKRLIPPALQLDVSPFIEVHPLADVSVISAAVNLEGFFSSSATGETIE
jgi:hypothetical protein